MEERRSENTTLCYIEKENCYLMMHRVKKSHDVNKDKWVGVGGHFEAGESPEECLLREVKKKKPGLLWMPIGCGAWSLLIPMHGTDGVYVSIYGR